MHPDIVIVPEDDGYRLLHGHLRLANLFGSADEITVDIPGEGEVRIFKTRDGFVVGKNGRRFPLVRS